MCCEESEERFGELCGDRGMKIVAEIVRTASAGDFDSGFSFSLFMMKIVDELV